MKKLIGFIRPFILQPWIFSGNSISKIKKREVFFHSFNDAFLCIFKTLNIKKDEIILLPEFYCPSTISFFAKYMKTEFYKINHDFTVSKNDYFEKIRTLKPKIILNYCFIGFDFSDEDRKKIIEVCGKEAILVDDFTHRLIETRDIKPIFKNHFYIFSFRKNSPLLGCQLINKDFSYPKNLTQKINWYKIKCHLLQNLKGCLNFFSFLFKSRSLYLWAEKIFLWLDDLVGTNGKPTMGCRFSFFSHSFLNFNKIKSRNKVLLKKYNEVFKNLNIKELKIINSGLLEKAELNYYPLGLPENKLDDLLNYLIKNNIFADKLWEPNELDDKEINFNIYNSFIIFPLGWIINEKDIEFIGQTVERFFKTNATI